MDNLLRLSDMVARDILKILLSGKIMGPKDMAIELDVAPQSTRNAVVHLNALHLIERVTYGKYQITDFGRGILESLESGSSPSQSSRRTEEVD